MFVTKYNEYMERVIKFRIWNGIKMEYDITVGRFGAFYVHPEKGDGLNLKDTASLTENTTKYYEGTPVMQFTGLKDKNSKEIWEGDIVQYYDKKYYIVEWALNIGGMWLLSTIKYDNGPHGMGFEETEQYELEVIGNISENPELLK